MKCSHAHDVNKPAARAAAADAVGAPSADMDWAGSVAVLPHSEGAHSNACCEAEAQRAAPEVPALLAMGWDSGECPIEKAEVMRYLGHAGQTLDSALEQRIDEGIAHCRKVSRPAWAFRIMRIDCDNNNDGMLQLAGTPLVLEGSAIRSHLDGARYCAVMLATCGLSNERELQRLAARGDLDALVFDAASSALTESAADACNARIVAWAREQGLFCNWRFGPGYGDLPLALQPYIVHMLEADKRMGVSTTPSHLLVPTKSVTGLIGLFDEPREDRRTCAGCSLAVHCTLRERGLTCYR